MHVFIIGAGGYIGSAVAHAFRRQGHRVQGLVRKEEQKKQLLSHEIEPILGDIENPSSYLPKIKEAEVLINCASEMSGNKQMRDSQAIDALLEAAKNAKTPRTLIYTSGCWRYGNSKTKLFDESTPPNPLPLVTWRPSHEEKVLKATSTNLRTVVMIPGCVYGRSGSLTSYWFGSAQKGNVQIAGDGSNYWSMVHIDDLAQAYVLAAEKEISGVMLNIVEQAHHTVKELAEAVAKTAGIPGKISLSTPQEAHKIHGALADGLLADQKMSGEKARRLLGWQPRHIGFIEEVDLYYQAWMGSL